MERTPLEQPLRIACPVGLDGVEILSGTVEDAGQPRKRVFADYALWVTRGAPLTIAESAHHEQTIPEGTLVMMEPETVVSVSAEQPYDFHMVFIPPSAFALVFEGGPGDPGRSIALPKLWSSSAAVVRVFLAALDDLARARSPMEGRVALLQLVLGLIGAGLLERPPGMKLHSAVISRAREHIRGTYARGITLDELSGRVGMCKYALVRAFTREFGLPPHMYQTYLRVMKARSLIRDGRHISDAALEVGFTDQSHLHRHFKRMLGCTPGSYAKQVLKPAQEVQPSPRAPV